MDNRSLSKNGARAGCCMLLMAEMISNNLDYSAIIARAILVASYYWLAETKSDFY
jgi:hypothetical protein